MAARWVEWLRSERFYFALIGACGVGMGPTVLLPHAVAPWPTAPALLVAAPLGALLVMKRDSGLADFLRVMMLGTASFMTGWFVVCFVGLGLFRHLLLAPLLALLLFLFMIVPALIITASLLASWALHGIVPWLWGLTSRLVRRTTPGS